MALTRFRYQCHDTLVQYHARQSLRCGPDGQTNPENPALYAEVCETLKQKPDDISDQTYQRLRDAIEGDRNINPGDTVTYHGDKSYSLNGPPIVVSHQEDIVLREFLECQRALATQVLQRCVENPSRVIKQLEEKFPTAVRRPQKKGDGYFIRVQQA